MWGTQVRLQNQDPWQVLAIRCVLCLCELLLSTDTLLRRASNENIRGISSASDAFRGDKKKRLGLREFVEILRDQDPYKRYPLPVNIM